ncbi:response regulator transcription factor [Streptomyces sp. NPDC094468]|uniref:response regulator transcription factor n=1 Tax=Streptomyces sp. NPDC094468 TaxID=3366066 RepID=UPI00381FFE86
MKLTFPWARSLDPEQLAAFIDDLWGAAGNGDDLATLDAIERVIAHHRRPPEPSPLTPRETEILTHLARGETQEEAGQALGIERDTVRGRMPQIFGRLGAKNAVHAVTVATAHGWLPDVAVGTTEPPTRIGAGPAAWKRIYRKRATWMRDHPGTPVEIGPYFAASGAQRAARCIRQGLFEPFQPAGQFTASYALTSRSCWVVTATYIGHVASSSSTEGIAS